MAEVVKKKTNAKEYKISNLEEKKQPKKEEKVKKEQPKKKVNEDQEKKSLWTKFRIFCHGVRSETKRVHWTSKNDMVKYSIATIFFIIFCSIFFFLINVIFAFVQSLFA